MTTGEHKKYVRKCEECGTIFEHEDPNATICFNCAVKNIVKLGKEYQNTEM